MSGDGTTTIDPGAQLRIGEVGKYLDGRNLEIEQGGSVIWYEWGDIVVNNGAEIHNRGKFSANAPTEGPRMYLPRGRTQRRFLQRGGTPCRGGCLFLEVYFHNSGTLYVEDGAG